MMLKVTNLLDLIVYILFISKELFCLMNLKNNYSLFIIRYSFAVVEDIGVEPMTLCVQGRCSSQLS